MSTSNAPLPYEIVSQDMARSFRANGTLGFDWTVTIRTPDGTISQIILPDEQYTAKNVHALALMRADEVMRVANLPGSLGT